ncbi:MAG TPA: S8/S53 family peptidase [Jiangellales bacterium]|nr:S8/S53 family peptidase [Jiangellales bacterium]
MKMAAAAGAPERHREQLELLRARRDESPVSQKFDILSSDLDSQFLVVRDELLTTRAALEDDEFRTIIDDVGLEPVVDEESSAAERSADDGPRGAGDVAPPRIPEDYLEGRVVRLRWKTGNEDEDIGQALDRLRNDRYQVSRLHLMPLGAVMKGETTPEYTSEPWPVWEPPDRRGSVPVAVIDTGIAHQPRDDGWLTELFPPQGRGEEDPLDVLPNGPDDKLDAGAGHGSFVAGVVQQVAPEVPVMVYRVLDTDGLADEVQVACAMVKAVDDLLTSKGRLILNLSLGTQTVDDLPPIAVAEALVVIAERASARRGEVLVIAAAGNEGTDRRFWPAAFDQVVAVAGLDPENLEPAEFSSHGPWVDCSTVAVAVRSPYVQGEEDRLFDSDPETWEEPGWAQWNGTSFAAPQVAAEVARRAGAANSSLADALDDLLQGEPALPGYGRRVRILG